MRESSVRWRFGSKVRRVLAAASELFLLVGPCAAASMPPRYRFRTLESMRVRLHFHTEVESPARRAMALILEILPRLEERYEVRVPSLEVVVHDASDSPNGLATSFPYPLVEIRTASSDGSDSGPTESWLRMVVTHELTHIVHMEQAGGIYALGRRMFGRAPFLFPNALQPTWFIEGLAVSEETRGTIFGRGRHAFTKMVVDEAARSGDLARMDRATLGLDLWPRGQAPYLFGNQFLSFIEAKHGEGAPRDIASTQAASFRPYLDGPAFRRVTGRGLTSLWRDFAQERAAGLAARGGSPAASQARGFSSDQGAGPKEYREYFEVQQRRAGGKDPLRARPDFHHGLLGPAFAPTLLTSRGGVQRSPRLSPDGALLAYQSRTLDRIGEIRLMRPDGSGDRRLTWRTSGSSLSWARDGKSLFFDDFNLVRKFESRSDLYSVDVETGQRKRLTTGLRASDPDAGPGPKGALPPLVFVQRFADRSELAVLAGGASRAITASLPGTEWSHPRFSPSGDAVVASRLANGFMDIVLVDPVTGFVSPLTKDRALDAEPAWVDARTVIFRSDREETAFRFFLVNRDGSSLRRIQGSPGNAFTPEVDLRTRTVFFASYSAKGYDLARAPFAEGAEAEPFVDPFALASAEPPPFAGEARPYRAAEALGPRFVSPFAEVVSDEWRPGLVTFSFDPLLRVAYGLAGTLGTSTGRPNGLAYLRFDRFTPTVTVLARAESSPATQGVTRLTEGRMSIVFPLERSFLRSQTASLTVRRRREDLATGRLDTGVLAMSLELDSTRTYPMSISPQDGVRLRVAATRELRALGSDLNHGKVIAAAAAYPRLGRAVLVARLGGGWTFGSRSPRGVFAVGGLASPALLDPAGDEPAVLRGYRSPDGRDASRFGRKLAFGNLEARLPLWHPQRGIRALPFFIRHLSLTSSLDAAAISSDTLRARSARVGASVGLAAHLYIGHRVPLTLQGGLGRGLNRDGATVPWFSIGFPF